MPWQPLPRIAFAVATFPFAAAEPADLPLELGDELYIIEETPDGNWLRGYLVAPPSLLAGLTSVKGQTLEARVFSGIFPRSCVEVREVLGEGDDTEDDGASDDDVAAAATTTTTTTTTTTPPAAPNPREAKLHHAGSDSAKSGLGAAESKRLPKDKASPGLGLGRLSSPVERQPGAPRPLAPVPMLKIGDETPTSESEPLIDEIASCLREWHSTNLHGLLLSRQYAKLDRLSQLITTLNRSRQQFLHNVMTAWEYANLREKTVWDLVRVNKLCGGEVIVRDPKERGRVLTGDDSVVDMTRLQSVMSLLDEPPTQPVELTALHHLMVDVQGFTAATSEAAWLVLYLASRTAGGALTTLSESYIVEVPPGSQTTGRLGRNASIPMRTLFADLSATDIGEVPSAGAELFLVVKIRAPQQVAVADPSSRSGGTAQLAPFAKDAFKPPLTPGSKSVRRSLMWTSKNARPSFSRGNQALDTLSEQPEEPRPWTTAAGPEGSRDGLVPPPRTAGSKGGTRTSTDHQAVHMTMERTVGVGLLRLDPVLKHGEQVEQVIGLWTPSARFASDRPEAGKDWDPMIREVEHSKTGQFDKSRVAERLLVHVQLFDSPDADALIKSTPTVLAGICKTNKMGFTGAPTRPRSDIYVTVDEAMLSRQTLLSRYGGGATSLPSHVHGSSLQVTLEVRRASGERIENCIHTSSNTDATSCWKSVAVERGDPWRQTLKLQVAPEDVRAAHMVLHLADLPGPPFALAYMPLWEQQAFIRDGAHTLLLYKMDANTTMPRPAPGGATGGYLDLAFTARGPDELQADVTGPLAAVRVQSYLCSTRFSQDRVVLGLLKWKEGAKEDIPDLLKRLVFVAEIEVVKLLSDVLDALFGILVEHSGNDEYEDLVFTALVRVLDIVHDRRFDLAPLLDEYAENRFNYPFATPCLVRSFTRLLAKPTEPETARKLRATFKVVRQILKFITHARGQQKLKEAGIGITGSNPGFTRHLRSIFKALDAMMSSTAPVLVGSQTLAVQHFHTWLPELAGLLTAEEIVHIAIDFMDSCAAVKGKLVLYKLVLIINYAKLDIFSHPEKRSALSANTVRWIAPHWGHVDEVTEQWEEQVRLCCSVLASQVEHLGPEIPDYIPKIIQSYLAILATKHKPRNRLSLLFPTQYPFPTRATAEEVTFNEALVELSAVLSALSNSPSGMQLELAEEDLHVVVGNALRVHMSILQGEAFPANWLSVHIFHHKSTMRTLQYLGGILLGGFLPHPDDAENFRTELWKIFFATLLKLVGSPSLALETFPEQKRRAVWKIAGDVREAGAELLRRTWEAIGWESSPEERTRYGLAKMGGYQVQYVPTLVGPIVELCLSVHEGLRRTAVEVLQTMMVSEWTLSEDLSVIQTEMIDGLDLYLKSKPLTESILQKLFVDELVERFRPLSRMPDDPVYLALSDCMATVNEFLDLLITVHSGDGSGEASHMMHRLRLMEFLRDMRKEDIFIRYVHQLAELQAEARNHTEAGLALRLHADLYEWDPIKPTPALAEPPFPAQSHFERRERLYFAMIKHFEDGEAWGSALDAYGELQAQYAHNTFDFAKLARTGRAMATVHEALATRAADRPGLVPKYFKVVFRGLGFPPTLRDRTFIFEGASPAERTAAFTDRLQAQYPSAQVQHVAAAADARLADDPADGDAVLEGQVLHVAPVAPHRDLTHPVFGRARVPAAARDWLVARRPREFAPTSGGRRCTTGPVAGHFAERTVYTTAETFPTILKRSEVVGVRRARLSAQETALERIVRKTAEMAAVERRVTEGDASAETARLLVDAVGISVNPRSESSVVCYRELLPTRAARRGGGEDKDVDDDEQEEEDDDDDGEKAQAVKWDPQETAIKMALIDHAIMLRRCLAMFARSKNEILTRNLTELQKHFESTFSPEIATFSPARDTDLAPTWPGSPRASNSQPPPAVNGTSGSGSGSGGGDDGEEVSTVQPVALQQAERGSKRLSFLSGRKKETQRQQQAHGRDGGGGRKLNGHAAGDENVSASSRSTVAAAAAASNRLSFFRPHSAQHHHQQQKNGEGYTDGVDMDHTMSGAASGMDWVTDSGGHGDSGDWEAVEGRRRGGSETTNGSGGGGGGHGDGAGTGAPNGKASVGGAVRKRLSLLKLRKKTGKAWGDGAMRSLDEE